MRRPFSYARSVGFGDHERWCSKWRENKGIFNSQVVFAREWRLSDWQMPIGQHSGGSLHRAHLVRRTRSVSAEPRNYCFNDRCQSVTSRWCLSTQCFGLGNSILQVLSKIHPWLQLLTRRHVHLGHWASVCSVGKNTGRKSRGHRALTRKEAEAFLAADKTLPRCRFDAVLLLEKLEYMAHAPGFSNVL